MKLQNVLIIFLITSVLFACKKEDKPISKEDLIGKWKLTYLCDTSEFAAFATGGPCGYWISHHIRNYDGNKLLYNYYKEPIDCYNKVKDTTYYMESIYDIRENGDLNIYYKLTSLDGKSIYEIDISSVYYTVNCRLSDEQTLCIGSNSTPITDNDDGLISGDLIFSGTKNKLILTDIYDDRNDPRYSGYGDYRARNFKAIFERIE